MKTWDRLVILYVCTIYLSIRSLVTNFLRGYNSCTQVFAKIQISTSLWLSTSLHTKVERWRYAIAYWYLGGCWRYCVPRILFKWERLWIYYYLANPSYCCGLFNFSYFSKWSHNLLYKQYSEGKCQKNIKK